MKITNIKKNSWYAVRLEDSGRFDNGWIDGRFKTIKEAKEAIDARNKKMEEIGRAKGKFIITMCNHEKVFVNDIFYSEKSTEEAVEIYGL